MVVRLRFRNRNRLKLHNFRLHFFAIHIHTQPALSSFGFAHRLRSRGRRYLSGFGNRCCRRGRRVKLRRCTEMLLNSLVERLAHLLNFLIKLSRRNFFTIDKCPSSHHYPLGDSRQRGGLLRGSYRKHGHRSHCRKYDSFAHRITIVGDSLRNLATPLRQCKQKSLYITEKMPNTPYRGNTAHFPKQNVAKTRVRISSVSTRPDMEPRASSAALKSTSVNSGDCSAMSPCRAAARKSSACCKA